MRVATKLTGAFGLFIVILAGVLGFHIRTIRHAVSTNFELSDLASRVYTAATRQIIRIGALEENASKYRVTRDPGYLEKFAEARDGFEKDLHLLAAAELSEAERLAYERLDELWGEVLQAASELQAALAAGNRGRADLQLATLHQQLDDLRDQARDLGDASQAAMVARMSRSAEAARHAERISWSVLAAVLLLGIAGSGLIIRSISEALRRLQAGTREVAEGNFEYRLESYRDDEFAQLARDFNVMTRRLGELDQMKKDFLSKVSHDLKTPLASMQETTRALLEEVSGPLSERQQRLLHLNHQSGERLSAMIAKILELSALEAGALGFEPWPRDLVPLVRRAVQEVELANGEYDVRIVATLPEIPLVVACDEERTIRVLVNLLENAVKFSPRGGTVGLSIAGLASRPAGVPAEHWNVVVAGDRGVAARRAVGMAGRIAQGAGGLAQGTGGGMAQGADKTAQAMAKTQQVTPTAHQTTPRVAPEIVAGAEQVLASAALITISDNGPGIPDEEKALVFERFFQAESGKRIHRRGVGLGLTICREIVTAHQGALWVDDTPGGGSTFSLLLPCAEATGPVPPRTLGQP